MIVIPILSALLVLAGLVFFLGAVLGLVRFPDFYSRMHAAGKGDTLSSLLVVLGLAVYQLHDFESLGHDWPVFLVILKLLAISVFILITSPTSTSALIDAGWEDGVAATIDPERENALQEDENAN